MSKNKRVGAWMPRGIVLAVGLAPLLAGCGGDPASPGWEYMPDMVHSVAYDSFARNPVTPDRKTLRAPSPGTVPRGFQPFPYGPGPEEAARAGRELADPLPASPEVMARAERLFRTFCQPCHGATGQGDGPVTQKFPPPPAYTSTGTRDLPAGRIYHVISRGSGRMPSYASQIDADDRWRLVRWIQKLQRGSPPAIDPGPPAGERTAASRATAGAGATESSPKEGT